ncbi:MAG: hypothetical protein C4290_05415 [Chloroflexota bacterium]
MGIVPRWGRWLLPVLGLFGLLECQWYTTAPAGRPALGVNFSCQRARYLDLDCDALLAAVLDDLGARLVRLSVYWHEAEPAPGRYEWQSIERQLNAVHARGGRAVVSIGMKAQRFPEYWLPEWLRRAAPLTPQDIPEHHPLVRRHLLAFLDAAARRLSAHPAVEALQVENEPFVNYRPNRLLRWIGRERYGPGEHRSLQILFLRFGWNATTWRISESFLAEEVATVRAAAPGTPIVLTHASWLRTDRSWRTLVDLGDVLGQSVYTKRQLGPWPWLYIFPYRLGPLSPHLPAQVRVAARQGKELWITELQAEPFEKSGMDERYGSRALRGFTPRRLTANLSLARRTGATRVYLWGVEWWAYLNEWHGDDGLWRAGRTVLVEARGPDHRQR